MQLTRAALQALWIDFFTPDQTDYDNQFDSFYNIKSDSVLFASAGTVPSIELTDRNLLREDGTTASVIYSSNAGFGGILDLVNSQLKEDQFGLKVAIQWSEGTKILNDDAEILSLDWSNRRIYDDVGDEVADYRLRVMFGFNGNTSLNWGDRTGHDSANATAFDWSTPAIFLVSGGYISQQPSPNGAGIWKLGKINNSASVVDATKYLEVDVDGTLYKLTLST